jgi:hypothetical protein
VRLDHLHDQVVVLAGVHRLDEHALLQVAGADPDRVVLLDLLQHLFHPLERAVELGGQVLHGRLLEVPVRIDVAQDEHADLLQFLGQVGHLELPDQVVVERLGPGQGGLEGRELVRVGPVGRHRRRHAVVIEVVLPVDLVDRRAVGLDLGGRLLLVHHVGDGKLGVSGLLDLPDHQLLVRYRRGILVFVAPDLEVVLENRVLEHLLADQIHQLHPG